MTGRIQLPDQRPPHPELVLWAGGSKRLAKLLQGRSITTREDVEHLLNPLAQAEPDLGDYPPLVTAVERINQALIKGERIAVYGDYDVDGITATTVLVTALNRLDADVIWHIPNRFTEGYGIHPLRVEKLAQAGAKLIITCDCGISNYAEILLANSLGMDVIITDHHTPPELLPPALSIVNFKQLPQDHPSRDLPGVGTAYILVRQLFWDKDKEAGDLLDLVALGIIADVVPLRGHSRQLYSLGLAELNKAGRPGLKALFEVANLRPGMIDEEKIGFQIAPRINAAGRLDDGSVAVNLFLAEKKEQAAALARELDQLNSLRKELGRGILDLAASEPGLPLVAYHSDWHQGVIGIAAGQFSSANQAPAILMTNSSQGESIVGSARSVEGIDIYDILKKCSGYLDKYGGHPAAAGFSLSPSNLEGFRNAAQDLLNQALAEWIPQPIKVDLELKPGDINLDLVEDLNRLAPWGEGNPRPLLYCRNLLIKSVRPVGSGQILTLGDRRQSFSAGLWNGRPAPEPGVAIGAVFTVSQDIHRGEPSVWATLEAWWPGDELPQSQEQGPEFIDMRNKSWREIAKKYSGAGVYREGAQWQDHPGQTRNNLESNSTVVLLTPPPSPAILRQILAMAEPELVVVAFSPPRQSFVQDLLGALKYIITQEGGITSLTGLAAGLGHTEQTILTALRLLAESEIIDFQIVDGKAIFQRLTGTKLKAGPRADKLRMQVEETLAFQKWLIQAKIPEIIKIRF